MAALAKRLRKGSEALAVVLAILLLLVLYCGTLAILWVRSRIRRLRHRMRYAPLNSAKGYSAAVTLKECTGHITNVPSHVALAVLEDVVVLSELAKVIIWCLTMGVRYITVYDLNATAYKNVSKLEEAVRDALQDVRASKEAVKFLTEEDQDSAALEPHSTGSQVSVRLIGPQHGKRGLASVLRRTCEDYASGRLTDRDLTQRTIERYISELSVEPNRTTSGSRNRERGASADTGTSRTAMSTLETRGSVAQGEDRYTPDPEVMLRFGSPDAVLGYPPWELNHIEMLDIVSLKGVLASEFVEAMEKYSKTEKRFGR